MTKRLFQTKLHTKSHTEIKQRLKKSKRYRRNIKISKSPSRTGYFIFLQTRVTSELALKRKKKVPSPQHTTKQTQTKFFASHVQITICIPCHLVYISKATEWCSSSKSLSKAKLKSFSAFRCVYIQTE